MVAYVVAMLPEMRSTDFPAADLDALYAKVERLRETGDRSTGSTPERTRPTAPHGPCGRDRRAGAGPARARGRSRQRVQAHGETVPAASPRSGP